MVKPSEMPTDSPTLKKVLHEKIDRLNDTKLSLLNRVLLQLEADELGQDLDNAFDRDRQEGKLTNERIQQVLAQIRAEHSYR